MEVLLKRPIYEYTMQDGAYVLSKQYSYEHQITRKMVDCVRNTMIQKFYRDLGMSYWVYGKKDDFECGDQKKGEQRYE